MLIFLLCVGVSACVSERTYTGTGIPVGESGFNKRLAAQQRAHLGLVYLRKGNNEQAKRNLDLALTYAPELEAVHLSLAYYYQWVADLPRAEQAFRAALKTVDVSGDSYNNFGVFLCQQGSFAEAERLFLAAVKMPNYTQFAGTYENLGLCSQQAGNREKARNYFKKALRYDPKRKIALIELMQIQTEHGSEAVAKPLMQ